MKTIDREELEKMMENGDDFKLVEVLGPDAFENFHLPQAINVPLGSNAFDERIQAAANKDDTVVVYCKDSDCDASPRAAERMEDLGFTNVMDYADGKEDWRSAGLPVE